MTEEEHEDYGEVHTKIVKVHGKPSEAEVEEHVLTHLPFRSWCPCCVEGQAVGHKHEFTGRSREGEAPTISFDYMFMSERQEYNEGKGSPIMVMVDILIGMMFSNVMISEGVNAYSIARVSKDLSLLGYSKLIL